MEHITRKRIVVAMSGGVDSSVTAALLQEQGHEVIGISMQLWDHSQAENSGEKFGTCCSLDDIHDARRVASQLDIPFYVVNFQDEFRRLVVEDFVDEYFHGRTPNPCVRCNERMKFDLLLRKARGLGGDYLATGHYARVVEDEKGIFHLIKGEDDNKDQSYFLFTVTQEQLRHILFPVGMLTKTEVRKVAARLNLRVAEKHESQEICFVPDGDYAAFLEKERGEGQLSGDIVDTNGSKRGGHTGTYRYTIGQRRGLGIAHTEPLYVVGIDPGKREVIVGIKGDLLAAGLIAGRTRWISSPPADFFEATCKIRYRQKPVRCLVRLLPDNQVEVRFVEPEKSVTPGQAVVFYKGDEVLGGGWIEEKITSIE